MKNSYSTERHCKSRNPVRHSFKTFIKYFCVSGTLLGVSRTEEI